MTDASLSKSVVIIDDDEYMLSLMRLMLNDSGIMDVRTFASGASAVDFFESAEASQLDMVLCDWKMPEMDGLMVLERFRRCFKHAPFLLITVSPTADLVSRAKRAGATDLLAKPFREEELRTKVISLIS